MSEPFAIEVESAGDGGRRFRVSGAGAGEAGARSYELRHASHSEYLRLFESLARDFGTRMPLARGSPPAAASPPGLRALLTENLTPEILYGYGDPAVIRPAGGGRRLYYAFVTSNDAPHSFPILSSADLGTWRLEGFAFPPGCKPGWAAPDGEGAEYWAPELHEVAGGFLLCFAAREPGGALAIGLATSDSPTGPFVAQDRPLLTGGVIDPHIHVDAAGAVTLFWKQDSNDIWPGLLAALLHRRPDTAGLLFPVEADRRTARLVAPLWPWIRTLAPMERFLVLQTLIEAVLGDFAGIRGALGRLARDGDRGPAAAEIAAAMTTRVYGQRLDPARWSLVGEPVLVLQNDHEWEGHLVEGAWVWAEGGLHYIFYSANDFSTANYGVGVGVGASPLGPYTKQEEPLLRSTPDWWGLGHPSVARAPDGRPHLFLHGFRRGHVGYKEFRALLDVPLEFTAGRVAVGD